MGFLLRSHIILLITVILVINDSLSKRRSVRSLSPRITLKYFIESDSFQVNQASDFKKGEFVENEFITKNGSVYTINAGVDSVSFSCEARYPVKSKMPMPEQFSGMTSWLTHVQSEVKSTLTSSLQEPRKTRFYSYLSMNSHFHRGQSQTGFLTCEAVDDSKLKSTIYVFFEGLNPIENMNELTRVNVSKSKDKIIIPCRPSIPEIKISLSKLDPVIEENFPTATQSINSVKEMLQNFQELHKLLNITHGLIWDPLELHTEISYDPKIGFTIATKGNHLEGHLGLYKCSAETGDDDVDYDSKNATGAYDDSKFVFVTTGKELPKTYEFEPHVSLGSRTATLDLSQSNVIKCCTGNSSEPAAGAAIVCQSEAECEFFKPLFVHDLQVGKQALSHPRKGTKSGCFSAFVSKSMSKLVYCKASNLEVVGEYVSVSNADGPNLKPVGFTPKLYESTSNISAASLIQISASIPRQTYYKPLHPFPHVHRPLYPFPSFRKHKILDIDYPELGLPLTSSVYNDPILYYQFVTYTPVTRELFEGESIVISCQMHRYWYAIGGWLRLNWKNGTKTVFSLVADIVDPVMYSVILAENDIEYAMIRQNMHAMGDPLVVGKIAYLDVEMESVDCFAPVWKNKKWGKRKFELTVRPTALPEFENPTVESITLRLNESKTVNCTIINTPQSHFIPASITWKKDGKTLSLMNNGIAEIKFWSDENVTTSSLIFSNATFEMHGEYECVAENVKGQVVQRYLIFVEDDKSGSGIVGMILLILVVCLLPIFFVTVLIWKHRSMRVKIRKLMYGV